MAANLQPPASAPGNTPGSAPGSVSRSLGDGNLVPPNSGAELLLGLPKQPLSPQQQMEALRKVQSQAEQRVKLGMQLFKAAEARVGEQRDVLSAIKVHQKQLQDHVSEDVAKTLQQYDQWMGKIDERFTQSMRDLEQRFDRLETSVNDSQQKIEKMMKRAESMLEQTRLILSDTKRTTCEF